MDDFYSCYPPNSETCSSFVPLLSSYYLFPTFTFFLFQLTAHHPILSGLFCCFPQMSCHSSDLFHFLGKPANLRKLKYHQLWPPFWPLSTAKKKKERKKAQSSNWCQYQHLVFNLSWTLSTDQQYSVNSFSSFAQKWFQAFPTCLNFSPHHRHLLSQLKTLPHRQKCLKFHQTYRCACTSP